MQLSPAGGGQTVVKKVNIAGATLSVAVQLAPGKYVATVSTYDALNEGGHVLSTGQALPFTLVAGKENDITLVLGGVPHAFVIDPEIGSGTVATGFTAYGALAVSFTILSTDADGNYIFGPGTPVFTFSVSGAGWKVAPARTSAADPDTFTVTPPNVDKAAATVKVAVSDPTLCALAGSACTTSFAVTDVSRNLYVAICEKSCGVSQQPDEVAIFAAPYNQGPIATITSGIQSPQDVAADKAGNVFVANDPIIGGSSNPPSIQEYSPANNYAAPIATINSGLEWPNRVFVDASDNVIVNNCDACSTNHVGGYDYPGVYSASSHYTAAPVYLKGYIGQSTDMVVNSQGTIVVASCVATCKETGSDALVEYPAPYSAAELPHLIPANNPLSLALDSHDNLWEGECGVCNTDSSVVEYLPEAGETNVYSTSVANGAVQSDGVWMPFAIAVDTAGNLFVSNSYDGVQPGLNEYAPPYDLVPTAIMPGVANPRRMTLDRENTLLMFDGVGMWISAPPYTAYTDAVDETGTAKVYGEAIRFSLAP